MIKRLSATAGLLMACIALAQGQPQPKTEILLLHGEEVAGRILLPKERLLVKADSITSKNHETILLSGHALIASTRPQSSPLQITAERAQVETELVEVQLRLGDTLEFARDSVQELLSQLKMAPDVPRFRVTWQESALSYSATATATYDRRAKAFTFRRVGGQGTGTRRTRIDEHFSYTDVTTDEKATGILLNLLLGEKLPEGVRLRKLR